MKSLNARHVCVCVCELLMIAATVWVHGPRVNKSWYMSFYDRPVLNREYVRRRVQWRRNSGCTRLELTYRLVQVHCVMRRLSSYHHQLSSPNRNTTRGVVAYNGSYYRSCCVVGLLAYCVFAAPLLRRLVVLFAKKLPYAHINIDELCFEGSMCAVCLGIVHHNALFAGFFSCRCSGQPA